MAIGRVKEFYLYRVDDETGTSGVGIVARGAVLVSGKVALEWSSFHHTLTVFDSITAVEDVHSHNGKTRVVMGCPEDVHEEFLKELKKEQSPPKKRVTRKKKND